MRYKDFGKPLDSVSRLSMVAVERVIKIWKDFREGGTLLAREG